GDASDDFAVARLGCQLDQGLAPGERCDLALRFAPSAEGPRSAALEIDHNGPGSPLRVALSGSGEPPRPIFRASARDFGFGSAAVGNRSDIATLTVSNPGSAWLPLRGIRLGGEHGADFALVPGTCDGVTALAPGGSCTIGVRFVPTATGRRQGRLEIRHGADGSPAVISLAGVGS
ncbi:MAG: choice-of-anchor D domain-containing protein, partial [Deltaproteobacteria bacterium]|nr:choice-of-anchor D domain-containing protein [Deltaproteobacteria bacterium]